MPQLSYRRDRPRRSRERPSVLPFAPAPIRYGYMLDGPHQAYRVRDAPLIAAARIESVVRIYSWRLSRRAMWGIALLAVALAVFAYLRGAELYGGLVGAQPPLLPGLTGVSDDDQL
jgi:hypothetical protein